jgi:hypothetical protein
VERYVEIRRPAGTMRGMLNLPKRSRSRPPRPGVVLYHGFTSQRTEFGFLFVKFSRLLAEAGIAGVRFDFIGCGESDGRFQDVTLSSEIEDAGCVLDFMQGRREVDSRRLFLLGMSMGGTIAGFVSGVRPTEVAGLLLWAAAGETSERIREGEEALRKMTPVPGAPAREPTDYWGLRISSRFGPDAAQVRVMETSARYRGQVLIAHGTSDQTVPPKVAHGYGELYGERARLEWIEGADHRFQGVAWREQLCRVSLDFVLGCL